jgi:hypothetical protein
MQYRDKIQLCFAVGYAEIQPNMKRRAEQFSPEWQDALAVTLA